MKDIMLFVGGFTVTFIFIGCVIQMIKDFIHYEQDKKELHRLIIELINNLKGDHHS